MKVTRIRCHNYRGIETLDATVSNAGAIVRGANGQGKTSVLRAIRAALEARDVAPDAIRHGATKAEILVDLDHVTVRRVITAKGSTVTVATADGMERRRPQTWLDELVGPTLDPLALYLAPAKERRARVLEALPVRVTREQLRQWAPDLPDGPDVSEEHGLEVLERVRKHYYDKRRDANAVAGSAAAAVKGAQDGLHELEASASDPDGDHLLTLAGATVARDAARRAVTDLDERRRLRVEAETRTAEVRERIAHHDAEAVRLMPADAERDAAGHRRFVASDDVARLRRLLADAEVELTRAMATGDEVEYRRDAANTHTARAKELASMIASALPGVVTDDEHAAAVAMAASAEEAVLAASERDMIDKARAEVATHRQRATAAQAEADRLDGVVQALTHDAPRALLTTAGGGIPGLGLDGDAVTMDGTSLDALCGAEQLRFAVRIAKRANAGRGLRLLVVDGLERLDPDQLDVFLAEATADEWQVLATRVDRGDMVVEAIEPATALDVATPKTDEVTP